jgi:RNA polymerase sigma factor (TIGR02999 family)
VQLALGCITRPERQGLLRLHANAGLTSPCSLPMLCADPGPHFIQTTEDYGMTPGPHEVTQLLIDWRNGDQGALAHLMPLVYDELRQIAARSLRRERPDYTLQATALVHEAYLRLVDQRQAQWQNRAHFFGIAAQVMRRLLVDYARRQHAAKRGGAAPKISLDEARREAAGRGADVVALDEALTALAALDPQQSRIVELRFFGGLTIEETAEVIGVSPATVKRDWSMAKAWLYRELHQGESHGT